MWVLFIEVCCVLVVGCVCWCVVVVVVCVIVGVVVVVVICWWLLCASGRGTKRFSPPSS